ncbi:hypothetical protein PTSG_10483 [Salpingoeca rosetta]|uniref:Uncharacterized protein n=1 Tax=Salpingoeca rosetta (strain ATCC 50818 / BSB-021) TaxID=946362 RepID=F2UPT0_SALR5|nr:uncharacterized protein PTSG_10483 [Salpingoeca rosetta]EGD79635.1 hypothetical protein PTSG_10483 [Salpingoeca rosetta]|eukprot:XP_004988863.1 hypothetical protein PTSG_10483 [Salpingoeca rosetta]
MAVVPQQINLLAHSPRTLPIVAAAFDEASTLYWVVSREGYIASYELPYGLKFSAWHLSVEDEIVDLVPKGSVVCVVRTSAIDVHQQGSLLLQSISSSMLRNITCATDAPRTLNMFVGTEGGTVVKVDAAQGTVSMQVELDYGAVNCLRCANRFVAAGTRAGKVVLLDRRLLVEVCVFDAFKGGVESLASAGNILLAIGRDKDGQIDPIVRVYDVKHKHARHPMIQRGPPATHAALVRPQEALPSAPPPPPPQVITVNAHHHLVIGGVDGGGGGAVRARVPLNMPHTRCTGVAVAPSGQIICVADSGGSVHVIATTPHPVVSLAPAMALQLLDRNDLQAHTNIAIDDYSKSLGFMLVQSTALSEWEFETQRFSRPPIPVPEEIQANLRLGHGQVQGQMIGYAPNLLNWRVNQVQYASKFLRRPRGYRHHHGRSTYDDHTRADERNSVVPLQYRKCDIKYTLRGLDGFDFEKYNGTPHCGLEPDVPNSYCNALLQALYFNAPLRALCVQHHCDKENCVACELGFLFQMMSKIAKTCQATNFLRCVRTSVEAKNLPLLVPNSSGGGKEDIHSTIRSWLTFIFSQLEDVSVPPAMLTPKDQHRRSSPDTPGDVPSFKEQFCVATTDIVSCLSCKSVSSSQTTAPVLALHAPEEVTKAVGARMPLTPSKPSGPPPAAAASSSSPSSSPSSSAANAVSPPHGPSAAAAAAAAGRGRRAGKGAKHVRAGKTSGKNNANDSAAAATAAALGENADLFADVTFDDVMNEALCNTQVLGAHCKKCGRFRKSNVTRRRDVTSTMLCIECPLTRDADMQMWRAKAPAFKGERTNAHIATPATESESSSSSSSHGNGDGDGSSSDAPISWLPWRLWIRPSHDDDADTDTSSGSSGKNSQGKSSSNSNSKSKGGKQGDGKAGRRVVGELVTPTTLQHADAQLLHHQQQQQQQQQEDADGRVLYELVGAVFHIKDEFGNQHSVSVVKTLYQEGAVYGWRVPSPPHPSPFIRHATPYTTLRRPLRASMPRGGGTVGRGGIRGGAPGMIMRARHPQSLPQLGVGVPTTATQPSPSLSSTTAASSAMAHHQQHVSGAPPPMPHGTFRPPLRMQPPPPAQQLQQLQQQQQQQMRSESNGNSAGGAGMMGRSSSMPAAMNIPYYVAPHHQHQPHQHQHQHQQYHPYDASQYQMQQPSSHGRPPMRPRGGPN